jgi:hypothetical protein
MRKHQKLAESKYVKYIAPKQKPVIHNTHARKNVSADIVQAAERGLIGTNVKVAVFDDGHVAKDHPSFRGRLTFDPSGVARDGRSWQQGGKGLSWRLELRIWRSWFR